MGMANNDESLTVKDAATLLGGHPETIRRLARKGSIPAFKLGRDWRFNRQALTEWAESHSLNEVSSKVLIVDDEKAFRETTRIFLETDGYEVTTAANGDDGLRLARKDEPDIVLLDLIMPGISGVDFLKELHKMYPDIPVIMITAWPDAEIISEAMEYAPITLLPKPASREVIIKAINRTLLGSLAINQ
ncbi:hypothetical protein BVX97_03200 [bacterium E08(2017)]|nr:hypothetical protein BVX97_03200 [bacterium E08(2017)]